MEYDVLSPRGEVDPIETIGLRPSNEDYVTEGIDETDIESEQEFTYESDLRNFLAKNLKSLCLLVANDTFEPNSG